LKVCSVCNEIVSANQRCALSNCPNKGSARPAPKSGKVTPGPTGRSDRAVQAGLDRAGDVARDATRRAAFVIAISFAVVAAIAAIGFNIGGGNQHTNANSSEAAEGLAPALVSEVAAASAGAGDFEDIDSPLPPNPEFNNNVWTHNGSTVRLYASGVRRTFYYEAPRSGLPVEAGQLLFYGSREGDTFFGKAYRFSSKCGEVSYEVTGKVHPSQTAINLSGNAPKRDEQCNVIGTFVDSLKFELLHQ
jgi:hypothetical protein